MASPWQEPCVFDPDVLTEQWAYRLWTAKQERRWGSARFPSGLSHREIAAALNEHDPRFQRGLSKDKVRHAMKDYRERTATRLRVSENSGPRPAPPAPPHPSELRPIGHVLSSDLGSGYTSAQCLGVDARGKVWPIPQEHCPVCQQCAEAARYEEADAAFEDGKERINEYFSEHEDFIEAQRVRHAGMLKKETQRLEIAKSLREVRAFEAFSFLKPVGVADFRPPAGARTKALTEDVELAVMLTDLHFGEVIPRSAVDGLNAYSLDIGLARLDALALAVAEEVEAQAQQGRRVVCIKVLVGGDLTHGDGMREVAKKFSALLSTDHEVIVTSALDVFVRKMAMLAPRVETLGVPGNHGRIGPKGQEPEMNNTDAAILQYLKRIVKARTELKGRVTVEAPNTLHKFFLLAGHPCVLDHGHMAKFYLTTGSVNSVKKRAEYVNNMVYQAHGIMPEHHFVGHFHTYNDLSLPCGMVHMSDALTGTNVHGLNLGLTGRAAQTLFVASERKGLFHTRRVFLDHIDEENAPQQLVEYIEDEVAEALYAFEEVARSIVTL